MLLGLVVALAVLPGAAAADDDDFSRSGAYVGIGGVYTLNSLIEDQVDDAFPGFDIDVDDSAGVSAVLGYRMLPFLSAELQYEYIDGFDISAAGTKLVTVRAHTVTGNLKAIAPIWRVQPYLLAGAGVVRWDFDDKTGLGLVSGGETAFAGRVGAGADLYLTRNIVLNAGVNAVLTDTSIDALPGGDDIDYLFYITAGGSLQYRF
jgi:opacity protein-like surface antigen